MPCDLAVGDRIRFDHKRTVWYVRALIPERNMVLATCAMFGTVYYTICDFNEQMRGPMNVIGGGLSIFTNQGPDPAVDEAAARLRQKMPGFDEWDWEVSYRNRVPLRITEKLP